MGRNKIAIAIDELRGTVGSLSSVCERLGLDPDSPEVTSAVDDEIFACHECEWWCEIDEEVSEFADLDKSTCRQCALENHNWEGE